MARETKPDASKVYAQSLLGITKHKEEKEESTYR